MVFVHFPFKAEAAVTYFVSLNKILQKMLIIVFLNVFLPFHLLLFM